jgi:hypothetical protein
MTPVPVPIAATASHCVVVSWSQVVIANVTAKFWPATGTLNMQI